jgi:hypothetical protein
VHFLDVTRKKKRRNAWLEGMSALHDDLDIDGAAAFPESRPLLASVGSGAGQSSK